MVLCLCAVQYLVIISVINSIEVCFDKFFGINTTSERLKRTMVIESASDKLHEAVNVCEELIDHQTIPDEPTIKRLCLNDAYCKITKQSPSVENSLNQRFVEMIVIIFYFNIYFIFL